MATKTKATPAVLEDHNKKYEIASWEHEGETTTIYLLNPGDWFDRFGGSRHALPVKKTASLIVRRQSPMGLEDVEHNINDRKLWDNIFRCANMVKYAGGAVDEELAANIRDEQMQPAKP